MTETVSKEAQAREAAIRALPLEQVGHQKGVRGGAGSIKDIWNHRELLVLLVRREVKARYKDSSLGLVWSLFRPLAQLFIYYFAIGQILGAARSVPDFGIFVFIGLTTWALFNEIINGTTTSVIANAGLVKKVYLPREIFPLAAVGSALFNFGVQSVILVLAILVLSTFPVTLSLLLIPLALCTLVVFATAIGLLLSAVNVYLRDTQHLVEIATMLLFWVSPIVYSFSFVHNALNGGWLEQLYLANPITLAVIAMQKALWAGGSTGTGAFAQVWPPDIGLRLLIALAISLLLLLISQRIFARLQGNFAQEL